MMLVESREQQKLIPLDRPDFYAQIGPENINSVDGIMVVRLINYERVQDLLGYDAAQEILFHVQLALQQTVPQYQQYLGRIAETTFAVPLSELHNKGHAQLAVMKFLRLTEDAFGWNNHKIVAHTVVGLSSVNETDLTPLELLRQAELSLSAAVKNGYRYAVFEQRYANQVTRFLQLEGQLQEAIHTNELELYYQPKIDIQNDKIYGAESLARWHAQGFGAISPDEFIGIAEESGQILDLTKWAIKTAFRQAKQWSATAKGLTLALNISAPILMDPDFVYYLESAAAVWDFPLDRITIEITESEVMHQPERSIKILQSLKDKGICISIDDFGTGYSSLAYLKDIPADEIKIDKAFIQGMANDLGKREIVRTIIALSHGLGYRVVAEGVEDLATLELLHLQGCDIVQGFYFSKALPQKAYLTWLKEWKSVDQWISSHS